MTGTRHRPGGAGALVRDQTGVPPPTDLRARLRAATTERHRRLDHAPANQALMAPGLTLAAYVAALRCHGRALEVCETALRDVAHARPAELPVYRPRGPALAADLADLGRDGAADVAAPLGASVQGDPVGAYLGLRYVLDGSTMGAAAIARRLAIALPELPQRAFRYWRVQAEEAASWAALARALADRPAAGGTAEAAIVAAHAAFDAFLRSFGVAVAPAPEGSG